MNFKQHIILLYMQIISLYEYNKYISEVSVVMTLHILRHCKYVGTIMSFLEFNKYYIPSIYIRISVNMGLYLRKEDTV